MCLGSTFDLKCSGYPSHTVDRLGGGVPGDHVNVNGGVDHLLRGFQMLQPGEKAGGPSQGPQCTPRQSRVRLFVLRQLAEVKQCKKYYTKCINVKGKGLEVVAKMPAVCPDGTAQNQWNQTEVGCPKDHQRLQYRCCPVGGTQGFGWRMGKCHQRTGSCALAHNQTCEALAYHRWVCNPNEVLQGWSLQQGRCTAPNMEAKYTCCEVHPRTQKTMTTAVPSGTTSKRPVLTTTTSKKPLVQPNFLKAFQDVLEALE